MITADAPFTLRSGTKSTIENAVYIYVSVSMYPPDGLYKAYATCINGGVWVDGQIFELTKSDITHETGSGSNELEKSYDQIQKAVATKLAALSENVGVIFTVS